MKKTLILFALAIAACSTLAAQEFKPNSLVLSRSVYSGDASTVTVGQTLPPGCVAGTVKVPLLAGGTTNVKVTCTTAIADGTYPTVFNNNSFNRTTVDGSFGVTSPIFLDNLSTEGKLFGTLAVPSDEIVTSFSSKSELALNLSVDGKSITFVGYRGGTSPSFPTGPNQLDVSNSNTPGVVDPSNPVVSQYYRAVAEVDADGNFQYTDGNAYSGNNGRAAAKANGTYYLTGNNNNGGLSTSQLTSTQVGVDLVTSTGAELLVPGQAPPVPPGINMIGDFSVTQVGYKTPDKPGKDNNFRGLTIFNNTMYVTKGSGGNGINTVYQVGNAGTLPAGTTAELASLPITILPGFPTSLASGVDQNGNPAPVLFPFGIFFADANTLYVCDEGDGVAADAATGTGGMQKWSFSNGSWHLLYTLQAGLDLGVQYAVPNYPSPATDGCRNITGKVNGQGTVVLYAVTSTVSASGDQGADPNKLVKVTDLLKATTLPNGNGLGLFTTIRSAAFGEVFRGVSFAPGK
jgi:hypothetical protein